MIVQVTVNGDVVAFEETATVGDVAARVLTKPDGTFSDRGVAVAVNQLVVPRNEWASTLLHAGDKIEVITAVQGG